MTRPRMPLDDDERLARRRAQYRNAKRRKAGKPVEPILPPIPKGYRAVSVLVGSSWLPALIDDEGRRVFLR